MYARVANRGQSVPAQRAAKRKTNLEETDSRWEEGKGENETREWKLQEEREKERKELENPYRHILPP
jgi:hypothetical protein